MTPKERKSKPQEEPQEVVELPLPVSSVTNQIFADLLADRTRFTRDELTHIQRENPALHDWLLTECITSATRELSLDWALAYYAIYSRSSRKTGTKMPRVTEQLIDADFAKRISIMNAFENQNDTAGGGRYILEEIENKRDALYNIDANRSVELFTFWTRAQLFELAHLTSITYVDTETGAHLRPLRQHDVLHPLYNLATYLHRQAEANRLQQQFQQR